MKPSDYAVDGIVVTGAGGALGSALVQYLLAAGRRVHAVYHHLAPAEVVEQTRLSTHCCELSDGKAVQELFNHLVDQHGGVEAVVNAAGGFVWAQTEECEDSALDFLLTANFKSAFCLTKYALPHLRQHEHGRIVLVSAAVSLRGGEVGMGAYLASKAAINALMLSTAAELPQGITINVVCPTVIDTPRNRRDMPQADFSTWVSTATISRAIAMLLSSQAGSINGALIPVA